MGRLTMHSSPPAWEIPRPTEAQLAELSELGFQFVGMAYAESPSPLFRAERLGTRKVEQAGHTMESLIEACRSWNEQDINSDAAVQVATGVVSATGRP
jgi:hypothetical protein